MSSAIGTILPLEISAMILEHLDFTTLNNLIEPNPGSIGAHSRLKNVVYHFFLRSRFSRELLFLRGQTSWEQRSKCFHRIVWQLAGALSCTNLSHAERLDCFMSVFETFAQQSMEELLSIFIDPLTEEFATYTDKEDFLTTLSDITQKSQKNLRAGSDCLSNQEDAPLKPALIWITDREMLVGLQIKKDSMIFHLQGSAGRLLNHLRFSTASRPKMCNTGLSMLQSVSESTLDLQFKTEVQEEGKVWGPILVTHPPQNFPKVQQHPLLFVRRDGVWSLLHTIQGPYGYYNIIPHLTDIVA
jgi:hypothetical protein